MSLPQFMEFYGTKEKFEAALRAGSLAGGVLLSSM